MKLIAGVEFEAPADIRLVGGESLADARVMLGDQNDTISNVEETGAVKPRVHIEVSVARYLVDEENGWRWHCLDPSRADGCRISRIPSGPYLQLFLPVIPLSPMPGYARVHFNAASGCR